MENLNIAAIIGGNIAVSTSDGEIVFSNLSKQLNKKEKISLDFAKISILTTAFLNAAIGQLYSGNTYPASFLNEHLKIINVRDIDKPLFSLVINRAKEYYQNKKNLEESVNTAFHG
ncbi:MAG TPA: STAS-like domain-containing protein [Chitinophagaceae bacterium]|jgi:hypothetical protein